MITKFIFPFLLSLEFTAVVISFLLWLGKKYTLSNIARRLGGLAIILVFALLVLLNKDLVITRQIAGILVGGFLILFFGLWDDFKDLSWKRQLVFQIFIAAAVISFGVRSDYIANPLGGVINLQNPLIYFLFFIFYFLFFINSLNWLDGIDGLSGSVTLVALAVIAGLSFKPEVNQPAVAILCAIAGGAIVGFLILNWKPARILAGTTGAWFFGFILASLSIFAGAKIATVLMVALIPALDFFWVIFERKISGQSIFAKDNRHLHFKLLKLGIGERQVVFFSCLVSAGIGIIALKSGATGKLIFILAVSSAYFFSMIMIRSKAKEKK